MDSATIDLGPDSHAAPGDEVTILDDNPLSPVSAYALARWADTIPYEILCRIGPRIKRVVREVETDDMAIK
jgi:alanine racemase